LAQALQNPAWKDKVEGFEKLCVNALADYRLVSNEDEVNILAFNAVEETEESRENDGFTGTRKALLVVFAVTNLQKEKNNNKGQKWTYQEVHEWLKTNIKFHDEKAVPSAHTCKDLFALATDFIKNKRAFAAYQEAETLWGRSTMFDEYSKLIIACQKSRSEEDLAFIAEWLLADMKAHSLPPKVPDNPSQSKLKECGGPISVAQAARDALISLLQKDVPPTWSPFRELLQNLVQPSRFLQMFPPGCPTPETTVKLVAGCPPSLKQAFIILRGMYDGSKNNMWREKVMGHLAATKSWNIQEKKLLEMFEVVFTDEWDAFKDARDSEAGRPVAKKIMDGSQAGDEEKLKADEGEAAGKTAEDKQKEKKEEVASKKEEIMGLARLKAQAVYTNPGVVILTPQKWESAALGCLMGAQKLIFKESGGFVAFWFAKSDREARVHTDQNRCLREAPLKKDRLLTWCRAINDIMVECQDSIVIGVGRVKGNNQIVQEVVSEMKWQYKTIDAVMERASYDKFVRSGNPAKKKKRRCGSLGTTQYKEVYYLCWKSSPDKAKRFPIKSGFREFVDKGSSIASDIMLNCPQVPLDEIYAVPMKRKIDALGEDGLETKEEAEQANHEDLTLPPTIQR
jgi:hypothetical protein